jgi:nicotinamidase-related amidase
MLFDPKKTALVAVDLRARVLAIPTAPYPAGQAVAKTVDIVRALKGAGGLLALVRVGFAPDFADALKAPVDAPSPSSAIAWGPDAMDTPPELAALKPDIEIVKRQWGAFHATELDPELRRHGVETIILTGVATNMGVEQTLREERQRLRLHRRRGRLYEPRSRHARLRRRQHLSAHRPRALDRRDRRGDRRGGRLKQGHVRAEATASGRLWLARAVCAAQYHGQKATGHALPFPLVPED